MTLIEVVIAMVIIIILVTGVLALFTFAGTTIFVSGEETRANTDGRTRTDTILADGFTDDMDVVEADDLGFLVSSGVTEAVIEWNEGAVTSEPITIIDATITVPAAQGREVSYRVFGVPVPPDY
jgi:uncharacterized protein YabE (DUF348 family)